MSEHTTNPEQSTMDTLLVMSDGIKRRIDALEGARAAAYKSFTDRRDYEWKMCIAIWTFLSVFASALVIGKDPLNVTGPPLFWGTVSVSTLACLLHGFWTFGISRANALDIGITIHYAKQVQKVLGINYPDELNVDIEKANNRRRKIWRWSHVSEVLFTAALGITASLASWYRC
jgi:hypothetical protein